ncbi:hypothetical protein AQUCO_04200119v1 [Aquilegia coerulea]|uniref:Uncharacterized protein n=1 Tax=Aquilegia coerulea TaxID=218851 RepID=A0A2G5CPB2_AQUCA|nr:hypothetical protein AQUCO_04200119v1 [Aquilegia coerulea]PIA33142.1 hypothetical protein AQUCO_04200119v1 [Aquilegia coerulea]
MISNSRGVGPSLSSLFSEPVGAGSCFGFSSVIKLDISVAGGNDQSISSPVGCVRNRNFMASCTLSSNCSAEHSLKLLYIAIGS